MADKVTLAQVGLGRWGQNLWKNFWELPDCQLRSGCDLDKDRLTEFARRYPQAKFSADFDDLIAEPQVQAVVIATPAASHYQQAKAVLLAGKDVFVEKPITLNSRQAGELKKIAQKKGRIAMTGHLLLYHPGFSRAAALIREGAIGRVLYLYFRRQNLGAFRPRENVLWDIGIHDLAMALEIAGERPVRVAVQGAGFIRKKIAEMAYWTVDFKSGKKALFQTSWLDPFKERKMVVVGEKGMIVFDEAAPQNNLKMYPKWAELKKGGVVCHEGEAQNIDYPAEQPLKLECRHFLDCVRTRQRPRSDAGEGETVLRTLEAADRSLAKSGKAAIIRP